MVPVEWIMAYGPMAVIFWYYKTKKVIVGIKPVPWVYRNVTSSFVALSSIFIPRFTWSLKSKLSQPKVDSVILSLQSVNYKFSLIFPSPKLACNFESAYLCWDGDRCLRICNHTHAEMYLTTSPSWLSSSLHVGLHWDLCIHIGPLSTGLSTVGTPCQDWETSSGVLLPFLSPLYPPHLLLGSLGGSG